MIFSDTIKSLEKVTHFTDQPGKNLWNEVNSLPNRMPFRSSTFDNFTEQMNSISDVTNRLQTFTSLDEMKRGFAKSYKDIKADKPPHSPNLAKWFDDGGSIKIDNSGDVPVWTYIDKDNRAVTYKDGYPIFSDVAKHPVIQDISIGHFTGDREKDKQLYLEKLEDGYGLTEIPEGYVLHHDSVNGNMQLVDSGYHKTFTHTGGHSLYKETEIC